MACGDLARPLCEKPVARLERKPLLCCEGIDELYGLVHFEPAFGDVHLLFSQVAGGFLGDTHSLCEKFDGFPGIAGLSGGIGSDLFECCLVNPVDTEGLFSPEFQDLQEVKGIIGLEDDVGLFEEAQDPRVERLFPVEPVGEEDEDQPAGDLAWQGLGKVCEECVRIRPDIISFIDEKGEIAAVMGKRFGDARLHVFDGDAFAVFAVCAVQRDGNLVECTEIGLWRSEVYVPVPELDFVLSQPPFRMSRARGSW